MSSILHWRQRLFSLDPSMSIFRRFARNVRFVLFVKTLINWSAITNKVLRRFCVYFITCHNSLVLFEDMRHFLPTRPATRAVSLFRTRYIFMNTEAFFLHSRQHFCHCEDIISLNWNNQVFWVCFQQYNISNVYDAVS